MSPNTTPSAAKLKPAAPTAETGLTFSAEVLVTRISMDRGSLEPNADLCAWFGSQPAQDSTFGFYASGRRLNDRWRPHEQ
jgi:hypothetical protein